MMYNLIFGLLLAAAVLVFPGHVRQAVALGPSHKVAPSKAEAPMTWYSPARLKEKLGLTEEQIHEIEKIDESQRAEREKVAAELRKAHQALDQAVISGASDERIAEARRAVDQAVDRALRLRIERMRKVAQVLKPSQRKVAEIAGDEDLVADNTLHGWVVHVNGVAVCEDPYVWEAAHEIECPP